MREKHTAQMAAACVVRVLCSCCAAVLEYFAARSDGFSYSCRLVALW